VNPVSTHPGDRAGDEKIIKLYHRKPGFLSDGSRVSDCCTYLEEKYEREKGGLCLLAGNLICCLYYTALARAMLSVCKRFGIPGTGWKALPPQQVLYLLGMEVVVKVRRLSRVRGGVFRACGWSMGTLLF